MRRMPGHSSCCSLHCTKTHHSDSMRQVCLFGFDVNLHAHDMSLHFMEASKIIELLLHTQNSSTCSSSTMHTYTQHIHMHIHSTYIHTYIHNTQTEFQVLQLVHNAHTHSQTHTPAALPARPQCMRAHTLTNVHAHTHSHTHPHESHTHTPNIHQTHSPPALAAHPQCSAPGRAGPPSTTQQRLCSSGLTAVAPPAECQAPELMPETKPLGLQTL
jgi:hypothetical protein